MPWLYTFSTSAINNSWKKATLWLQDLLEDLTELEFVEKNLKLLGSKGTTGTSESFMKLFKDEEKVKQIDGKNCRKNGL